jgi:hypothetical protein
LACFQNGNNEQKNQIYGQFLKSKQQSCNIAFAEMTAAKTESWLENFALSGNWQSMMLIPTGFSLLVFVVLWLRISQIG